MRETASPPAAGGQAVSAPTGSSLDLGLVGNGSTCALIDGRARVVWWCYPHFDGDPVCCDLLQGGADPGYGYLSVELEGATRHTQHYEKNTAILVTTMADEQGHAIEVIDFAPRLELHGRLYLPAMLVRIVRRVSGGPRVRVHSRPATDWGKAAALPRAGSNHVSFVADDSRSSAAGTKLRLTSDGPISALMAETFHTLGEPLVLIYGQDETVQGSPSEIAHRFLEGTRNWWRRWVRGLAIPFDYQDVVIRSAITLKLTAYEGTGAIIAAVTTSIPEAPGSQRNWDYRYCWLRDAYFVVSALNSLGATNTMEGFLGYIVDVIADARGQRLQPVYGLHREAQLHEDVCPHLAGYRGIGPVRKGNLAWIQRQHDVNGAAVLAAAHAFFDERLLAAPDARVFEELERLGEVAVADFDQPDAGIWELRGNQRVHTFSALMCWAAADRLARIAQRRELPARERFWREHAQRMHARIYEEAWNAGLDSFASTFGGDQLDASLMLMGELQFLPGTDPRWRATVHTCERQLRRGDFLLRYDEEDDFGRPEAAFIVCTLWWVLALAHIGETGKAREAFERVLSIRNPLGMLSEDVLPATDELWGNFPQTYSMVGLIQCAMRLSRPWSAAC